MKAKGDCKIAWEKWKDPWAHNESEKDDGWDDDYDAEKEDDDYTLSDDHLHSKAIVTPMGALPVITRNSPGKIFNFWWGHTNFDISDSVSIVISKILGVESLDVLTRHRMRISIGRLFKPGEVMSEVFTAVAEHLDNPSSKSTLWD